jgi:hypothetical protein
MNFGILLTDKFASAVRLFSAHYSYYMPRESDLNPKNGEIVP